MITLQTTDLLKKFRPNCTFISPSPFPLPLLFRVGKLPQLGTIPSWGISFYQGKMHSFPVRPNQAVHVAGKGIQCQGTEVPSICYIRTNTYLLQMYRGSRSRSFMLPGWWPKLWEDPWSQWSWLCRSFYGWHEFIFYFPQVA